jgi:hypothetical protein
MITLSYEQAAIILCALILFQIAVSIFGYILIAKDTWKISDIIIRLHRLEHSVQQLLMAGSLKDIESILSKGESPRGRIVFKSPDGKYTANSPEELMKKMLNDPEYDDLPFEDEQNLKEFFDDIIRDQEEEDDD